MILTFFSFQKMLQVLNLEGCWLSSEQTKDLMQMLTECHAATIQKVNLEYSANMESDEACESLVQLVDKSLSLTDVNLKNQYYHARKIGVSVIYAKSETEPGIITCATLKKGDDDEIVIDTVLFQRETQRSNKHNVVVDSSE